MERSNLSSPPTHWWHHQNPARNIERALFSMCMAVALLLLPSPSSAQDTSHSPGWVVLPVDEYRTLRARAFPPDHEPAPPPVEATLSQVDYDLQVNGDLASGRASLTVIHRSEEHTSELQSLTNLVCRLLLEKKKPGMTLLY